MIATQPTENIAESAPAKTNGGAKRTIMLILLCAGLAYGAYAGIPAYFHFMSHESTEDAFVEGRVISVNPRVSGHVKKIYVVDNQIVKKDAPLFEIDSQPFKIKLEQAKASLQAALVRKASAEVNYKMTLITAEANQKQASISFDTSQKTVETAEMQVAVYKSKKEQAEAQLKTAEASNEQDKADLQASEAEATRTATDFKRYSELFAKDSISRQQFDNSKAAADVAQSRLESARRKIITSNSRVDEAKVALKIADESLNQAMAQLAETKNRSEESSWRKVELGVAAQKTEISKFQMETAEADLAQATAILDQAELDLKYTTLYAPVDGKVSRKNIEEGSYVSVGQAVMAVVPKNVWVVANFKETQLTKMKPGQKVSVHVDAYPDLEITGKVDSIQAGTGARFSLLPPENATGNFVKVVQRVPVKIVFDNDAHMNEILDRFILTPGLSVIPEVKIK